MTHKIGVIASIIVMKYLFYLSADIRNCSIFWTKSGLEKQSRPNTIINQLELFLHVALLKRLLWNIWGFPPQLSQAYSSVKLSFADHSLARNFDSN